MQSLSASSLKRELKEELLVQVSVCYSHLVHEDKLFPLLLWKVGRKDAFLSAFPAQKPACCAGWLVTDSYFQEQS